MKTLALFCAIQETGCIFQKDEEGNELQVNLEDDEDLDDSFMIDEDPGEDANPFYEVLRDSCSLEKMTHNA